ncbi:MAG: response regulator, partial [Spirochaetes bacterium]|nr:response regulator [Spirochaetota bacterium]
EAIKLIENHRYDLILMDLQMPIMDGITATEIIRKRWDNNIPIIAMTADVLSGIKDEVIRVGMNDYIAKPFETKKLFTVLKKWLKPDNIEKIEAQFSKTKRQSLGLPDIKHLKVDTGVARLNGNIEAYIKLIKRFRKNNQNTSEEILNLIEKHEYFECQKILHTLKGVSGNISADGLFEATIKLESAVKNINTRLIKIILPEFIREFNQVLAAIEYYEKQETKNNERLQTEKTIKPGNIEEDLGLINKNLKDLREILKNNNIRSISLMKELINGVFSPELKNELIKVNCKIEDYEFEESLELLNNFVKKYLK